MTNFQQLQVWLRRADRTQRGLAAVAVALTFALVAWLVVPSGDDDAGELATTGPAGGQRAGAGASGTGPVGGADLGGPAAAGGPDASPGGVATGSDGEGVAAVGGDPGPADGGDPGATPADQPASSGQQCPPGTDRGATEEELKVAVTIINLAGAAGNQTVGVPTPETQRRQFEIIAAALNAEGGAGCRELVLEFFTVNPLNPSEAQAQCLAIANSGAFVAIDTGPLNAVGAADCIPNQGVPTIANFLTREQIEAYHPYYISPTALVDDIVRNGMLAHGEAGRFGGGFEKIGVLYRSCTPENLRIMKRSLGEAGVPDAAIVPYDMGCPAVSQNSPAEHQSAALSFRQAGASHVTAIGMTDFPSFTDAAAAIGYKPVYVLADGNFSSVPESGASRQPNAANLDGAVNVVNKRYGEVDTPGFSPTPGTQRCNDYYVAAGEPPVWEQQVGFGGVVCNVLSLLQRIADNAPVMQRQALAQGMHRIGIFDFSYPEGPVDFGAVPPNTPYPRAFWRTQVFERACACFKLPSAEFRRSFP